MRSGIIAFVSGIIILLQLPELPDSRWLWLLGIIIPLLFWPKLSRARIPLLLFCGFLWALWHGDNILSTVISPQLEGKDLLVTGVIASLPEARDTSQRFVFKVSRLSFNGQSQDNPGLIRLNWYRQASKLQVGDKWQLLVRLKRPSGYMNPGGFDYESWLFQRRIRATGYVRKDALNKIISIDPSSLPLQRIRQKLANAILDNLGENKFTGIITALAIGERQLISPAQWEVLTRTGTNHLVAISGLHVGLVAGLVFVTVRRLWCYTRNLALIISGERIAAISGIVAATIYAALAGFTLPTQRALIMISVLFLSLFVQRARMPSQCLAIALFLILIVDPFAVLSAGFWLSFSAVAVILLGMTNRLSAQSWWWKYGRLHVLIAIGLMPILVIVFQRFPLLSPLANFLAVPLIGFIVVPLVLLGTLLAIIAPVLSAPLLKLSSFVLHAIWPFLETISDLELGQWTQHVPLSWTWLPAFIGILWLLLPRGMPARWLGIFFLLPALLIEPKRLTEGEILFTLLDVGQGLSAVVQTRNHTLVYDTGPRFNANFDTGKVVLLPFLREQGISHLDILMVGHADNDHIGGVDSLRRGIKINELISSVPNEFNWIKAKPCYGGEKWQWDGIDFEILHPVKNTPYQGNNASCVLRISNAAGSILLSGDIETSAEKALLKRKGQLLKSDILIVPHHGSKTSSTLAFLNAISPDYALFPVGYRNRYGFPKTEILQRYQKIGAEMLRSDRDGAISVKLILGKSIQFQRFREQSRKIWYRR